MQRRIAVTLIFMSLLGGADSRLSAQDPAPLVGRWGGDRIRLDAATTGVRLQVECFRATVEQPIHPAADGTFALTVTFVPIRGVAPDADEQRPTSRVRGAVVNDTLSITIEPRDVEPGGVFRLERNAAATLPNCRIRG